MNFATQLSCPSPHWVKAQCGLRPAVRPAGGVHLLPSPPEYHAVTCSYSGLPLVHGRDWLGLQDLGNLLVNAENSIPKIPILNHRDGQDGEGETSK